jgi:hypothetical protein
MGKFLEAEVDDKTDREAGRRVVGGAVVATGAAVGGVALGVAGGLGGAYMNVKEGTKEVVDASRRSSIKTKSLGAAPPNKTDKLLLKDEDAVLAEKGRILFGKAASTGSIVA